MCVFDVCTADSGEMSCHREVAEWGWWSSCAVHHYWHVSQERRRTQLELRGTLQLTCVCQCVLCLVVGSIQGGQKILDCFWALITWWWLVMERRIMCRKFQNFVQKKGLAHMLSLICIYLSHLWNYAEFVNLLVVNVYEQWTNVGSGLLQWTTCCCCSCSSSSSRLVVVVVVVVVVVAVVVVVVVVVVIVVVVADVYEQWANVRGGLLQWTVGCLWATHWTGRSRHWSSSVADCTLG